MPLSRRLLVLFVSIVAIALGWFIWQSVSTRRADSAKPAVIIDKRPVNFVTRTFDPASPSPEMPPLTPPEAAECDSVFLSHASVSGDTRQTDGTHATVSVTNVTVTLQLIVTIWLPAGATQHIVEHENAHRQISEAYYQTADKLARQIAAAYVGKQVEISGADIDAEAKKALEQVAMEITDEYGKELDPQPTQLLFESITNHGTNDVVASEAAAHALKNIGIESARPGDP